MLLYDVSLCTGGNISTVCQFGYYNLLTTTNTFTPYMYLYAGGEAVDAVRPGGLGLEFAAVEYNPYIEVTISPVGSIAAIGNIILSGIFNVCL